MKRFNRLFLFAAVVFAGFPLLSQAQMVQPHMRSVVSRPGGARPATNCSFNNVFWDLTYIVGPEVDPTSNDFQAEEHIAIDPNNPNFLIIAVTDFSLNAVTDFSHRGSQATTKYAVSIDGGATWKDSFIPLSGGFSVYYVNDLGGMHGFLLAKGVYTILDFPGATDTAALGINDRGEIAGTYSGFSFAFLAVPVPGHPGPSRGDNPLLLRVTK